MELHYRLSRSANVACALLRNLARMRTFSRLFWNVPSLALSACSMTRSTDRRPPRHALCVSPVRPEELALDMPACYLFPFAIRIDFVFGSSIRLPITQPVRIDSSVPAVAAPAPDCSHPSAAEALASLKEWGTHFPQVFLPPTTPPPGSGTAAEEPFEVGGGEGLRRERRKARRRQSTARVLRVLTVLRFLLPIVQEQHALVAAVTSALHRHSSEAATPASNAEPAATPAVPTPTPNVPALAALLHLWALFDGLFANFVHLASASDAEVMRAVQVRLRLNVNV